MTMLLHYVCTESMNKIIIIIIIILVDAVNLNCQIFKFKTNSYKNEYLILKNELFFKQ
jgi:hypothetical protein